MIGSLPGQPTLPPAYNEVWDAMLASLPDTKGLRVRELTSFWPMVGLRFDRELMIIGRATNSWIPHWWADDCRDPDRRAAIIGETRSASASDGRCRMLWVSDRWSAADPGYNTAGSAFWRVVREVQAGLSPEAAADPEWPSRLVWSNLYKVGPYARNIRVPETLQRPQRDAAAELLRLELETYGPHRVLALTGWWFGALAERLGIEVDWREDPLVVGTARAYGADWVIAHHPQGLPGDRWRDEALAAFQELSAKRDARRREVPGG